MPHESDKSAISADIPADAIAEALAAVEKRAGRAGTGVGRESEAPAEQPPVEEEERLRLELDMSQERARKVFEQLKDEHAKFLRSAADLENYKKRALREKEEVQRYG